ncbi:MAG: prolyl oligopeptidase family serine peptidase, partial [Saprospiraceae bacterium]|nr:prolyl oligopeptidase family serine peptidase [Saprospiraceae bacterium]
MGKTYNIYALLCLILISPFMALGQTQFTPADALKVKSLRSTALSPNGNYLVGLRSASIKNRFDVDHFRFRDPSYIRPATYELVMYDIEKNTSSVLATGNIQGMKWSPDGSKLVYLPVRDNQVCLNLYTLSSKQSKEIPLDNNLLISSNSIVEWMPDNQSVLVYQRTEGWLETGMKMYEEATSGLATVYSSEEPFLKWDAIGNHSNLSLVTQVDVNSGKTTGVLPEGRYANVKQDKEVGAFLVFQEITPLKTSYNRKDGAEYSWKRVSLADTSDMTILQEKSKTRKTYTFSPNHQWMAWADSGHVHIQDLTSSETTNLTKGKNQLNETDTTEVKFSVEKWNWDATQLIARSKQGLWVIDRKAGSVDRFLEFDPDDKKAPKYSVLEWTPNGKSLYLAYNATDKWDRGVFQYDFEKEKLQELFRSTELYRSWQMAEDGSRWVFRYSDGDRPDEFFAGDVDLSNRRQITDLNPWLKEKKFTKTKLISYLDTDGKELYGILYYPVDYDPTKKYPLVCEIYERFFDNGYRNSMNIIANQGYFGFRPSVNLEKGRPGVAWIKGVTAGINKLIEKDLVDPEKIGVHGTSYGGYAASLLIAQTDRFAAAINISGKTNMISFLGDSPRIGTRNYAAAEVGQDRIGETLWEAPIKYIEHSAIMYADKMNTPHLLLTGEGDWNVPAANTRELYYALRRLGKEVVWVNYKTAGHGAGWAGTEETYHDQW